MKTKQLHLFLFLLTFVSTFAHAGRQDVTSAQKSLNTLQAISKYDVVWTTQSANSSESMPCGGGEQGLNIWAEDGDILFYMSRSSAFDENNALLKLGRVRIHLPEANFNISFRQELTLLDGRVRIYGANGTVVTFWVDVFNPVIHIYIKSDKAQQATVTYENWRNADYMLKGEDAHLCGMKGTRDGVTIRPDKIGFENNDIVFFHRNKDDFVFSKTVEWEELEDIKEQMWNPVKNRTFGGVIHAEGMTEAGTGAGRYVNTDYKSWSIKDTQARKQRHITIATHIDQAETAEAWRTRLDDILKRAQRQQKSDEKATLKWWKEFWQRSYIMMDSKTDSVAWTIGRNYQLFRYMLACNAYGDTPTKFNGSLFTFDPCFVKPEKQLSPDFRLWGGALMTAQNQRLVYWPMLKSGDWDMMDSQFSYYLRMQKNAELMTQSYWNHGGACFTEQIENFGLPVAYSYGMGKREGLRPRGKQANAYCEYLWDTVMDFCLMMIRTYEYEGRDVAEYVPFVESCLQFFDEHYRMLALQRTVQPFDRKGKYIFYPGTAGETYKMATNSSQTISALTAVLKELLALPEKYLDPEKRKRWEEMLGHMPPLPMRVMEGHKVIAPAEKFERLMNVEINQLYPVFPYDMYGLGRPDLELARDTWRYGIDQPRWQKNRHESWHQDAIFCARLGLLAEARDLVWRKLQNGRHRFPAFFGPGHDWTPDHNWGGTGMIALQEMLMQTVGDSILILPCWPQDWDVTFRLHAPKKTTIECTYRNGSIERLDVWPAERRNDVILSMNGMATADSLSTKREQPMNKGWRFRMADENDSKAVTLPHTWNDRDAQDVVRDPKMPKTADTYRRDRGVYERELLVPAAWKGMKRVFARFEAAGTLAEVFLNDRLVAEHKGGFTAFTAELTDDLRYGESNTLRVEVDNRWRADLAPISGGFAVMGGLYRPAQLLVTDQLCVSPLHYGSRGVYVDTKNNGDVVVRTHLHYGRYSDGRMTTTIPEAEATVVTTVLSPEGRVVAEDRQQTVCQSGTDHIVTARMHVDNPQLWQGRDKAQIYTAIVRVEAKDRRNALSFADEQKATFGFREVAIDKEQGFMLNGQPYPVYGVARHQDMKDKGWALSHEDNKLDMNLIHEMGTTAIRMAHYPQSEDMHLMADSMGMLVWDEVPLVNEVRNTKAFADNTREMMMEMMCQLYNHPSVCWWGLFNEIDYPATPQPQTLFNELNDMAHRFGGQRLTASASNKGLRYYNGLSDAPAWNNYPGWYWMLRWPKEEANKGRVAGFGEWMDYRSAEIGGRRFALSEYGAGGNPEQHMEGPLPEQLEHTMNAPYHPEEWQTYVHEEAWNTITSHRQQLWGSFIWAMFDFIVPGWGEGGMQNLNTKGLVSFDRNVRKDAFYFYKANWNAAPMVHICSKRMTDRKMKVTDIRVFSNCDNVVLTVNGKVAGNMKPDSLKRCVFRNVTLDRGANVIKVIAANGKQKHSDSCTWSLNE